MPKDMLEPVRPPAEFWQREDIMAALEARDIGALFRLVRQYFGASQTRIGGAVSMSQPDVSRIMRSGPRQQRVISLEVLTRIADGLYMPDHARVALGLAPRGQPGTNNDTQALNESSAPPNASTSAKAPNRAFNSRPVTLEDVAVADTETPHLGTSAGRRSTMDRDKSTMDVSGAAGHSSTVIVEHTLSLPVEDQLRDVALEAMKRRSLISWAAAATATFGSVSAGIGPLASLLGTETARHGLMLAATGNRANASIDEWDEIVIDYGCDYLTTPPAELLPRLTADVVGVQLAMTHANSDAERKELSRVGAMLAAFTAKTTSNTGDLYEARRWWRTARQIADESGDLATILWVRGQEIIRALYDGRDIDIVLTLIGQTESHASRAEVSMLPSFLSGKAQAFAAAGRSADARVALQQLENIYTRLPNEVTTVRGRETDLKWPASKYLFTASYVHAYSGALLEADKAQQQALKQYLPGHVRAPVQIKLHRALCMVMAGDITEGLQYARTTMGDLPHSHYVRPVIDGAYTVLTSVPVNQRGRPAYAEFAGYLAAAQPLRYGQA